jgi:nucleoid DNA-binding protein
MNLKLKDFTKAEIIQNIANKLYREAKIFNTEHKLDQAFSLVLEDLAEQIESGEWIKELEEELKNERRSD